MLLLSGYHKLADRKIYWEANPDTLCKKDLIQRLIIHLSVFFRTLVFMTKNKLMNRANS